MPMLYARLYCETCNTKHDHILGAHNKPQPHECPDCHKHLITSRMARYRDCVKLNTKQARERLKRQEEVWARMWDGFSEKAIVVRIAQLMQHPNIPHAYAIFEKNQIDGDWGHSPDWGTVDFFDRYPFDEKDAHDFRRDPTAH